MLSIRSGIVRVDDLLYTISTEVNFIEANNTAHPIIIELHTWQANLEEVIVMLVIVVLLILTASREMGDQPDRVDLG